MSRIGGRRESGPQLPPIVLFGDSLTQYSFFRDDGKGLGQQLAEMYDGVAEVRNEGHAGHTTQTLKADLYFPSLLSSLKSLPHHPLLMTIFLGANDATFSWVSVPKANYVANLRWYIDQALLAFPDLKILLIAPPPVNIKLSTKNASNAANTSADAASADPPRNPDADPPSPTEEILVSADREMVFFKTYVNKLRYAEAAMGVAREYATAAADGDSSAGGARSGRGRVAGLDFWRVCVDYALVEEGRAALRKADELDLDDDVVDRRLPGSGLPGARMFPEGFFTDGLHLGGLGYDVLTDAVLQAIEKNFPELMYYNMKRVA